MTPALFYFVLQVVQVFAATLTICDSIWRLCIHVRVRALPRMRRMIETQRAHAS